MAKDHSWESIVNTMRSLIAESIATRELTLTVAADSADTSESWMADRPAVRSVGTRTRTVGAFDQTSASGELSA
jgi:protein-tyrosine-phosphatase